MPQATRAHRRRRRCAACAAQYSAWSARSTPSSAAPWRRSRLAASGTTRSSSSRRTTASSSGDHGLLEKLGFFPQSYHILGLWRDPRRVDARHDASRPSPRTWTCCPRWPRRWAWTRPPSATDDRSSPSLTAATPWRATRRTTSGTTASAGAGATAARRAVDWGLELANLAVASGDDARLRPVRRRVVPVLRPRGGPDVAHRVRRRRAGARRGPGAARAGARHTFAASSPTCCCARAAGPLARATLARGTTAVRAVARSMSRRVGRRRGRGRSSSSRISRDT